MDPLTLAVVGGTTLANTAGGIFGNRARKREAKRARAHDINMWDKTNAYNDPKAQMERLRNAGLNPNMVYGGSSGQTAGQANALPGAKSPEIQNIEAGNPLMQYHQIKSTEAQTDNVRSQENLNDANTILATNKAATELQEKKLKGALTDKEEQMLKNLEEINNGLIQDTVYKTNKAKLSDHGRIGNENVIEQEWNKLRLSHPNLTSKELIEKAGPDFINMLIDMSPLKKILHGKSWSNQPDIKY
ncbi:DNA pilot protein [Microviridae sp.]|jgi:hypothetical protein|nr:DNA pilot protein [Microviridae sp.]